MGSYLLTVGLALALVLALAVGCILLMRRLVPHPASGRVIRIVETIGLEPRRSLHLVHIEDRTLLLGSTDGGVSLLTEFDKDEIELPAPRPSRRFIDLFRRDHSAQR